MIGIQILAGLFVLGMTYFSYLHYRRREFTLLEFGFWQLLWTALLIVVIFPQSLNFILEAFSISSAFDLLVVGGIVVLFGVTFRNYVIVRRLERRLEEYVRSDAIEESQVGK